MIVANCANAKRERHKSLILAHSCKTFMMTTIFDAIAAKYAGSNVRMLFRRRETWQMQ